MIYPWQETLWTQLLGWRLDAPHAILLSGAAGIGKLDFARELARFWLCENPLSARACGECPSCRYIAVGHHPDLQRIRPEAIALAEGVEDGDDSGVSEGDDGGDSGPESGETDKSSSRQASREIRIGQIQALIKGSAIGSHRQGRRVTLIYPAESMNVFTANALLKLLEEPPPENHLILISDAPERLLATTRSRCQQIRLPVPDRAAAADWLKSEGVEDADGWLAEAGGLPLLALRAVRADGAVEAARATLFEGLARGTKIDCLLVAERLARADRVLVVAWLQRWVWDCLGWHLARRIRYYPKHKAAISQLASQLDPLELARFARDLSASRRTAEHPLNVRLFFEDLLLRYQQSVSSAMGTMTP